MDPCMKTYENETLLTSSVSRITGTVFLLLAALLGLPGNAFIIWSILWKLKAKEKSVTCILILNLALADGTVLLLTPFFISFLALSTWVFGQLVCKMAYYICCLNMFASIFIITLMSLDRCLAVTRPYLAQSIRKKKVVLKIMVAIWISAILLAIPAFSYREVVEEVSSRRRICEPCHGTKRGAIFHYSFETTVAFIVPFTIIVVSYALTLAKLRGARFQQRARTEKLILAIILSFAVLWLPYHVVNTIQVASNLASGSRALRLQHAWKVSRAGATALAFFSCSVNPLLYAFAAGDLLRAFGRDFIAKLLEGTSAWDGTRKARSRRDLTRDQVNRGSRMESMEFQQNSEVKKDFSAELPPILQGQEAA
ncbi:LOW QUALITY PROTEIN: leukotriene B4 receptor 2-like [Rhinatrema bivittatum]|uniref:LOW QUALITY PROTEIN: leukotriene B4 receptor 2-like n=1 Tax=Rhinatrema bivittatum TaxID=194408 RepID=UPI0011296049|nr:LOW QUALITY PROTEIN: leukotriene B4 receptor 2-like [Rhinatrema bivittatum]